MKTARDSQHDVIEILEQRKVWFQPYWISNVIAVEEAPQDLILELAAREDVAEIRSDKVFKVKLEKPEFVNSENTANGFQRTPEWNVKQVKAPEAWAKGFTGTNYNFIFTIRQRIYSRFSRYRS
jgi:hypothetical protein